VVLFARAVGITGVFVYQYDKIERQVFVPDSTVSSASGANGHNISYYL